MPPVAQVAREPVSDTQAFASPFSAVCSNRPWCPGSPSHEDYLIPVAVAIPKTKSMVKKFSMRSRGSGASKFSTMLCCQLDKDQGGLLAADAATPMPSPSPGRSILVHTPLSMARKSRRAINSGETMLDRATKHAAAQDDVPPGIPATSPKWVLLSEFSDDHFYFCCF